MRKIRVVFWSILILVILINISPYLWMLINSFKMENEIFQNNIFPSSLNFDNYFAVLIEGGFSRNVWNSFVVSTVTTIICIVIGIPAAYAFARLDFKFKNTLFLLVLFITIFPGIFIISPLFDFLTRIGAIDTYIALILPYVAYFSPLVVWILTSFFRAINPSIEEVAIMDGCGFFQMIYKIIMPLALPGIITVAIIAFTMSWNEFMFALVFTNTQSAQTVPVAIANFSGIHSLNWSQMTTAAIVATLPIIFISLLMQKHIISGLTAGAVKE